MNSCNIFNIKQNNHADKLYIKTCFCIEGTGLVAR